MKLLKGSWYLLYRHNCTNSCTHTYTIFICIQNFGGPFRV